MKSISTVSSHEDSHFSSQDPRHLEITGSVPQQVPHSFAGDFESSEPAFDAKNACNCILRDAR